MSDERRKILEMLAEGKVSSEEAERLLDALEPAVSAPSIGSTEWPDGLPKYLFVRVEPKEASPDADQVKVTVPLALVKAGINFFSLLPKDAREDVEEAINESGFNFDLKNMNGAEWDALLTALQELEVDVETKDNTVKIWAGQ